MLKMGGSRPGLKVTPRVRQSEITQNVQYKLARSTHADGAMLNTSTSSCVSIVEGWMRKLNGENKRDQFFKLSRPPVSENVYVIFGL